MNQADFAHALLDPQFNCPPGLRSWNGSDPAQRFAVYRNNVLASLINALADGFPVVKQLVGDGFFTDMARLHAQASPPRNPVLAFYGEDFPDFIEGFEPAACLPYLADVARLERARVRAYHAADVAPLDKAGLGAVLADPEAVPHLVFRLHPSLQALQSPYAIASLWGAHQGLLELSAVNPAEPECALVLRNGLEVEVQRCSPGTLALVRSLGQATPLGAAVGAALGVEPGFDPGAALALLLAGDALTHFALDPARYPA